MEFQDVVRRRRMVRNLRLPYSALRKCRTPVYFLRWIQFIPFKRCTTRTPIFWARFNSPMLRVPPKTRMADSEGSSGSWLILIPRALNALINPA